MTDITPDHPAVESAMLEMTKDSGPIGRTLFRTHSLRAAADFLKAAYPDLTSAAEDNVERLRDTPAGRELMAEAWREALIWIRYRDGRWPQDMEDANPYEETPDDRL